MIYKICKCKNCGRHSVSISKIAFKCRYCNKSEKFLKKGKGLSVNLIYSTEDGRIAAKICADRNEKKEKIKGYS